MGGSSLRIIVSRTKSQYRIWALPNWGRVLSSAVRFALVSRLSKRHFQLLIRIYVVFPCFPVGFKENPSLLVFFFFFSGGLGKNRRF